VAVHLDVDCGRLTRYLPGGLPIGTGILYDSRQQPLEQLVEAEPASSDQPRPLRLAATAGQHFLRLLTDHGVDHYRPAYLERYPLQPNPADDAQLDPAARRFLAVLAGRTLDGVALYQELTTLRPPDGQLDQLPAEPPIRPDDTPVVLQAARAFLAWYPAAAGPTSPTASAWDPAHFEYRMAVASAMSEGEVVLTADDHDQGDLDWYSFDLAPPDFATLGAQPDDDPHPAPLVTVGLPTPVAFRGMPLPRYWQFEDAAVDFGDLTADPTDLVKLLLIQFGLVYGNDHFLIPVELDMGTISRIQSLRVTDTFGRETEIPPAAVADRDRPTQTRFRLFTPWTGDPTDTTQLLVLPPVLGPSLYSDPIEQIEVLRDEGANLAWAIETRAAPPGGFPLDRAALPANSDGQSTPAGDGQWLWRYHLRTSLPDNWFPLVAIPDAPGVSHYELGSLVPLDATQPDPSPWGRLLGELAGLTDPTHQPVHIPQEELTRVGARITRTWQSTRWTDGRQHAWVGRRRQPGRGEGSSGLRFDQIEPHSSNAS
jgi:hypothetical protein